MRKTLILLVLLLARIEVMANEWVSRFYPAGTRWTEIRYDSRVHDGWFTWDGSRWVPNYEVVYYYVTDGFAYKIYDNKEPMPVRLVYCQREGQKDSLILSVMEEKWEQSGTISVNVSYPDLEQASILFMPCLAYSFNDVWEIGKPIYYMSVPARFSSGKQSSYGKIKALGEGNFGGSIPLKYADVESEKIVDEETGNKVVYRIIDGVGITSWRDEECIFGANRMSFIYEQYEDNPREHGAFRSMLVHFERGGEVLYDMWPQPEGMGVVPLSVSPEGEKTAVYDLQGRKLNAKPQRGLYIQGGKMRMAW